MEQFRHIGEVLGSLKALMVLQEDIQFNHCQCYMLLDIFCLAFDTIAEEIRQNLKLEEKNKKWKALEQPLRELYRVFKEGELYIKHCLDAKDWWGKAISLHRNKDSVEFHIHNLFCYFPAVIEAIENAGEIAGLDEGEMQKRRVVLTKKYAKEWNDLQLFQWKFGKQYLVARGIVNRLDSAWREDRWRLIESLKEKRGSVSAELTKNEHRLGDLLLKKLNGPEQFNGKLFPSSILLGGKDYHVRRRLGGGGQYKEIQWLGESFVLRHFYGEVESLSSEISTLLSLSHPNILQYLCGFYDEEKKECLLVMELMSKDVCSYLKENCGSRRKILFSLSVVVDIMLQIARGMEYLHSRKIFHGDLNPSNVLLKARNSTEGYFLAKVSGFGLSSVKSSPTSRNSPKQNTEQNSTNPFIWHAPEVLAEQEQPGSASASKYTEKADVYSFGMLCFELLTGKVPFEDSHLQGEKMSRNIRAGERPLFPIPAPKYLVNLTKKCWQTDPSQRPTFSSICRILRYIKKFLAMNPDNGQPDDLQSPSVDFCDIEALFVKKFPAEGDGDIASVSQIPFEMFAYKLAEKDKTCMSIEDKCWVPASDAASISRDDNLSEVEDQLIPASDAGSVFFDEMSVCSEAPLKKNLTPKKRPELKMRKKAPGRILLISPHFLIYYWKGKIMFNSLGFYLT
jgi:serine/threonine protein kinase